MKSFDNLARGVATLRRGIDIVTRGIDRGADALERRMDRGSDALARGMDRGADALARGVAVETEGMADAFTAAWKLMRGAAAAFGRVGSGQGVLRIASLLLPSELRADWVEEHRAYLWDLPTRRSKLRWAVGELLGMPRYVFTVRTGSRKESA